MLFATQVRNRDSEEPWYLTGEFLEVETVEEGDSLLETTVLRITKGDPDNPWLLETAKVVYLEGSVDPGDDHNSFEYRLVQMTPFGEGVAPEVEAFYRKG